MATFNQQALLDNPLFRHIGVIPDGEDPNFPLNYNDLNDLFKILYEAYEESDKTGKCSLSFALTNDDSRNETIGFNATALINYLRQHFPLPVTDGNFQYIDSFLQDDTFNSFVFSALSSLKGQVQEDLPYMTAFATPKSQKRKEATRESTSEAAEAAKQAEKAKNAAENASRIAESIVPNMLTTLGIFVAIVVAVVASYLSVLLIQLHSSSISLSIVLLMGHILLNVIFLLLYLISKMSFHTLSCNCQVANSMDCSRCPAELRKHCHLANKMWLRYPYAVLLNGVFFSTYFVLGTFHLFSKYSQIDVPALISSMNCKLSPVAIFFIVVLLIVFALSFIFYRVFLRSPSKKLDKTQKAFSKKQEKEAAAKQERKALSKQLQKHAKELTALRKQIADLEKSIKLLQSSK